MPLRGVPAAPSGRTVDHPGRWVIKSPRGGTVPRPEAVTTGDAARAVAGHRTADVLAAACLHDLRDQVAFGRARVLLHDASGHHRTAAEDPAGASVGGRWTGHRILRVPIRADGDPIGMLEAEPSGNRVFTAAESASAADAATGLARSLRTLDGGEIPARSAILATIAREIDRATLAAEPLTDLAARIAEPLREIVGADRLALLRYDTEHGQATRLATSRSYDDRPEIPGPIPVGQLITPDYAAAPYELVMPDLRDVPAAGPLGTSFMLEQGLTCAALLPLVFDGRLQGGLLVGGFEPVCLAPDRLGVAREVAHRLAVAMAHSAARERSEQAIARLELLREIDAAVLGLTGSQRLAEIAVAAFRRIANASWTAVAAFDDALAIGTVYGVWHDDEPIASSIGTRFGLDGAIPAAWRVVPSPEPLTDLAAALGNQPWAASALDAGLQVGALVPLILDGRVVGAIALAGVDPLLLAPETLAVAQEIANRLAVAFAQDRDRTRLERARTRLEGLHELDSLILGEAPIATVAAAALRHVRSLTDVERALVLACDLGARTAQLLAVADGGELSTDLPGGPVRDPGHLFQPASPDAPRTEVVTELDPIGEGDALGALVRADGVAAVAKVPVLAGGRLEGILILAGRSAAALGPEALEVAEEVAAQLGVAITAAQGREANRLSAEAFAILHALDQGALAGRPIIELARDAADGVQALTGAAAVRLVAYDTEHGTATLLANIGLAVPDGQAVGDSMPLRAAVRAVDGVPPRAIRFPAPRDEVDAVLPMAREVREQGFQAGAWVPMVSGDRLVGALVLAGPADWRLGEAQLARASEIAAQLAVVVQAGRAREATERTMARLEFVGRVSKSVLAADSMREIAEAAVTRMARLPGGARAAVVEVDKGAETVRVLADSGGPVDASLGGGTSLPLLDVLPPWLVQDHRPAFVEDLRETPLASTPAGRAALEAGHITVAMVPLVAAGELLGALALGGMDARLLEPQQRAVITEVAGQLAIAMVHARARDALQHALERQQLVHEIDAAILASASVEEIASRVVEPLLRLTRARRLDISAYDLEADRGRILAFAQAGDGPAAPVGISFRLREVVPMAAEPHPSIRVLHDMRAALGDIGLVRTSVSLGLTAGAWVPLIADGRLIGAVSLAGADDMLLDDVTIAVAREVGDQLAVALQHQLDRDGMAERTARLAIVNTIGRGILAADGVEAVSAEAVRGLRELAGAFRVVVYGIENETTVNVLAFATDGSGRKLDVGQRFEAAEVLPNEVLRDHRPVLATDVPAMVSAVPGAQMAVEGGVRTAILEPVIVGDRLRACLIVSGDDLLIASPTNQAATREVAGLLALAIRHAEVQDDLRDALVRQRLVHEIDRAILDEESSEALAQRVAEPLRKLAGAKRLDIAAYDMDRDIGRILAYASDPPSGRTPPTGEFPLRATIPLVDHAMDGALVMRDLRDLGGDMQPVRQAIAQGLFNTLWMPLVAGGELLGGIGIAGDESVRVDEVRSGLASEVGDQLAVALLHERDKTALASREARLRTIVDESPNGIIVLDDHGVIQLANPAAHSMFLADSGSLAGKPVTIFVPDAGRAPDAAQVTAWFEGPEFGVTHPMDTEARRSDGSHIPVHVLLAPVETPEGRIAIATIVDLSDRVALEVRLRQAERLETLGQFAGVLAHDVRNHLAAVTWSAELMSAELAPDSPHREDVEIIRTATRDAIAMTKSVLEYARPTGEATGVTDVAAHIGGLSRMLNRVLGDDVKLETDLAADIPKAGIDATALTQVIVNLASNARDAMPDGGTFRIHARLHQGLTSGYEQQIQSVPHVHIEVSDTGLGMDEATRQRAFEAFYTTKGAMAERRGTGLGLSSVFLIVNRAGGGIRVASTPGRGTTFTVDLPIAGRAKA